MQQQELLPPLPSRLDDARYFYDPSQAWVADLDLREFLEQDSYYLVLGHGVEARLEESVTVFVDE